MQTEYKQEPWDQKRVPGVTSHGRKRKKWDWSVKLSQQSCQPTPWEPLQRVRVRG